jgi:hypothetical protein
MLAYYADMCADNILPSTIRRRSSETHVNSYILDDMMPSYRAASSEYGKSRLPSRHTGNRNRSWTLTTSQARAKQHASDGSLVGMSPRGQCSPEWPSVCART